MTISSVQTLLPGRYAINANEKRAEKPPPKTYSVQEFPFKGYQPPQPDGFEQSRAHPDTSAIVIDNGSHHVKAGWSFDKAPRFVQPPVMSRYRDRKLGRQCQFIGYDAYADATTRGQIRYGFDPGSSVVGNWDVMEGVLDYVFLKLGVDGANGGVDRPILMTEPVANMAYPRKCMNEILFECYGAPSVAYGIDSLFAYRYNKGTDGLIVSSSHTSTHVIPVLNSKPLLSNCSRLNWGGLNNAEYLMKLLKLKYPTFPARLTDYQMEQLVHQHCYISQDYDRELSGYLDWTGLEDRDHVIQYPYTEHIVQEKTEEELARIAERKKESGRRLQEQAAKMRLEKLVKKEQELEYWKDLQNRLASETKKEIRRVLESEDLKDEVHLERMIRDLEKSIKRSRNKDLGIEENDEQQEEMTFPMLDIPDEELDEAGLKEKRHQRLMKSNVEARARAKAEKEREKARVEEEERLDREKRENNFEEWIEERRTNRQSLLQRIKDRDRFKADLGNRKSLASQMRMKTLANLASDGPKKRRRGGDDDDFGANDEDWGVYRTVAKDEQSDEEEEEDLGGMLNGVEQELLEYDPDFTENHTLAAQSDWTKSLVHAFLRGPWPFDPESQREAHQIHLNVERIRVPEVVFKPSIAGVDQAGLIEMAADIINQRFSSSQDRNRLLKDVFLTGGNTLFQGFEDRFRTELRGVLPMDADLIVRQATDPVFDAWKGAAQWASGGDLGRSSVTRQEYMEKGSEYIKEHDLGNVAW
ncbi:Glutathione-dependent formaldehyde-activating enzyme/centromere protein V [Penicillium atrosanguineum]|uniref:Actin-like protein arp5 n=1 Tax=Penicillium atrosanguineum TaxID=1132637 RepID=A0A9W9PL52_9EURO|nr:Glutathione-dependent formaldehyde-activating enzyme/centromere protein V [Penicillium atrosanguineum]KAJ5296326.1 Glutathione-dependent formaldehyde-activating enzyme/centromere protein V [Penicillium atrosanguineum]KAJ5299095.1 Actin-like protein arp5 [Penicillium atrosanguineum]